MEVKNKVTVVMDNEEFGLSKGDVFYYNPVADMYLSLSVNEDVSDTSYSSSSKEIILSKDIVDRLIKDGVLECDEVKKANRSIETIDWEAYELGLQLKEMIENNKDKSNG